MNNSSTKTLSFLLVLVITAIVAGYAGYATGLKKGGGPSSNLPDVGLSLPTNKVGANSIITSQEAVAVGNIVKVDNSSITMQGSDNKISGFKLAPRFNIYPLAASSSAAAKPSQDVKDIKLNQPYQVHLFLIGSEFFATSIQALPNSPKK